MNETKVDSRRIGLQFFDRGDRLNTEELKRFGLKTTDVFRQADIRAIYAGVKRRPKKGEWYLSGAIVNAFRAFSDLTEPFHIARLVKTKSVTTTVIVADKYKT